MSNTITYKVGRIKEKASTVERYTNDKEIELLMGEFIEISEEVLEVTDKVAELIDRIRGIIR